MSEWNEALIARAISLQTLARKCVVLVPNCNWTGHECDVLAVTTDLRIIDVEVKISRSDLKADAKKDKWWYRMSRWRDTQGPDMLRQWPPRVWKHYYAMPSDLWHDSLFEFLPSPRSGVLLLSQQRNSTTPIGVTCARRATPNKDAAHLKPEQVMDIARLANLRMWESYKDAVNAMRQPEGAAA